MDECFTGGGPLAGIFQVGDGEVRLIQQAGPAHGVAAAGHPALDELQGIPGAVGQLSVVLGAVVHHGLHRVHRAGLLHDSLMLAAVVEFDGHAPGLDLLTNIVAGIQNAAGAVGLIAPGPGAVGVL